MEGRLLSTQPQVPSVAKEYAMKWFIALYALLVVPLAFALDHEHKLLDEVLKKNVRSFGKQSMINYQAVKEQLPKLDQYLGQISSVTKKEYTSFTRNQRLAFLINAYNAYTIKLILNNYPVKSIKKIGGWFGNPWKEKFFTLLGEKTSLDQIEHEFIRPVFEEPRIHFAVNCASVGCPNLRYEAFKAKALNSQLQNSTIKFLTDRTKNRFDQAGNKIYISKIFKWYAEDFEKEYGSVNNFIADFLSPNPKYRSMIRGNNVKTDWTEYDWNLNDWK